MSDSDNYTIEEVKNGFCRLLLKTMPKTMPT